MAKPRELAHVQVREIAAALEAVETMVLQRRQTSGGWTVVGYEYDLVLTQDQIQRLCDFLIEARGDDAETLRVVIANGL